MQKKNGISLIVLVITIIVMIILAGAIILTLNNSGIIDKANEAVNATNEAQVQEYAQLKWAEAYADGAREQEDLEKAVLDGLKEIEVDTSVYTITVTKDGVTVVLNRGEFTPPSTDTDTEQANLIPEGATYTTGIVWVPETEDSAPYFDTSAMVTYTAGQEFPETPQTLDRYVYGDYIYVYNAHWNMEPNNVNNLETETWCSAGTYGTDYEGWLVAIATDLDKTSYGEILESVNGKPILEMNYTFYYCTNLTTAPVIPSSVTMMSYTFHGCTSLTGSITINATPTQYSYCLSGTRVTEILGDCQVKSEILATK